MAGDRIPQGCATGKARQCGEGHTGEPGVMPGRRVRRGVQSRPAIRAQPEIGSGALKNVRAKRTQGTNGIDAVTLFMYIA